MPRAIVAARFEQIRDPYSNDRRIQDVHALVENYEHSHGLSETKRSLRLPNLLVCVSHGPLHRERADHEQLTADLVPTWMDREHLLDSELAFEHRPVRSSPLSL